MLSSSSRMQEPISDELLADVTRVLHGFFLSRFVSKRRKTSNAVENWSLIFDIQIKRWIEPWLFRNFNKSLDGIQMSPAQ